MATLCTFHCNLMYKVLAKHTSLPAPLNKNKRMVVDHYQKYGESQVSSTLFLSSVLIKGRLYHLKVTQFQRT